MVGLFWRNIVFLFEFGIDLWYISDAFRIKFGKVSEMLPKCIRNDISEKVTWYKCCDLIGFEDFAIPQSLMNVNTEASFSVNWQKCHGRFHGCRKNRFVYVIFLVMCTSTVKGGEHYMFLFKYLPIQSWKLQWNNWTWPEKRMHI